MKDTECVGAIFNVKNIESDQREIKAKNCYLKTKECVI